MERKRVVVQQLCGSPGRGIFRANGVELISVVTFWTMTTSAFPNRPPVRARTLHHPAAAPRTGADRNRSTCRLLGGLAFVLLGKPVTMPRL